MHDVAIAARHVDECLAFFCTRFDVSDQVLAELRLIALGGRAGDVAFEHLADMVCDVAPSSRRSPPPPRSERWLLEALRIVSGELEQVQIELAPAIGALIVHRIGGAS